MNLLPLMLKAAGAAAEVICKVYEQPIAATRKRDGSPVTEADAQAEAVILSLLAETRIPVLAEESVAAGRIPELGSRYFVVDPLDGTKEFLKRNGEFTVNIALVENGRPVLGVVLAPVTGDTYSGGPEGARQYRWAGGAFLEARAISTSSGDPVRIVASRSHGHAALQALMEGMGITEDVSVGSSLKFCLLAGGVAQLYPRFTPTCEWDTAAGQAVLEAAGGAVVTLDGVPLSYGKSSMNFLNPFFVAAADLELAQSVAARMANLLK